MTAWVLVANASQAYLYDSDNIRTKELHLIKELRHPQSREKGSGLISDRPGHYQTEHAARSAYERADPKAVEAEIFARELASELKAGLDARAYDQLILVAAPHFYGLINKHIDFSLDKFEHVPKDYTHIVAKDLMELIRKHLY